eukprot:381179_1
MRKDDNVLKQMYFNDNVSCNEMSQLQILDTIHCHYFHSFDTGFKLSRQDRMRIQEAMIMDMNIKTQEDADETFHNDLVVAEIGKIIGDRRPSDATKKSKL